MELILCHLREHIEEGDGVDRFVLDEGVETIDAPVATSKSPTRGRVKIPQGVDRTG
jgi:hypothetical protein